MALNKSIEELEKDIWNESGEFPTGLIKRCHDYRKIPIGQLTYEQLRTLISQGIGSKYLLPLVIEILESNPLAEGHFYPGDLLEATLRIDESIWKKHPELAQRFTRLVEKNEAVISEALGAKVIDQLRKKPIT